MKAITLWQPWASLLACGAKEFETRSWATSYRGPIAIHAAKKSFNRVIKEIFPLHEWEYAPDYEYKKVFVETVSKHVDIDNLCYGAIVATCELVNCHKIVRHGGRGISAYGPGWLEGDGYYGIFDECGCFHPSEQEIGFGDWTPGCYAWEFKNVKMLGEPIPAKGGQSIWEWDCGNHQAV